MNNVSKVLFSFLFIASTSFASSKAEQEAALNEIFNGLNGRAKETATSKYTPQFLGLVNDRLGDLTRYKGLYCRAEVSLLSNGHIDKVTLSNQNILCRKVFNAVWDIGSFPVPKDLTEENKETQFNLYISP